MLPSARDLLLDLQWRYRFVEPGTRATPCPGVLYLDCGGALAPGVVDHHSRQAPACSAALLLRHPDFAYHHLLAPWLGQPRAERTPAPLGLVTHTNPDFDGLVAIHLVRKLVEDGAFPPYAAALSAYAEEVDQGRYQFLHGGGDADLAALHFGYLGVQYSRIDQKGEARWVWQIESGLRLIEAEMASVVQARDAAKLPPARSAHHFYPGQPCVGAWARLEDFADLPQLLRDSRKQFEEDSVDAERVRLTVPALDGGDPIELDGLLLKRISRSPMDKYWARAKCPLFVCAKPSWRRVILSLDPAWRAPDGRRPCLRGLGYALEKEEVERRKTLHGGADDRNGPPRFDDGSCTNEDPWYDGRSFDWTIVDSPRSGTEIGYERILEILRAGRYWETELADASAWLVWTGAGEAPRAAYPVRRPDSLGRGLDPYFEGMHETDARQLGDFDGYRAYECVRRFTDGLTLRIARIERIGPGSLEGLLRAVREVESKSGDPKAHYRFVRVHGARWTPDPAATLGAVRTLSLGPAEEDREPVEQLRSAWINARSFVCVERPGAERFDAHEAWLYMVFLRESLDRFSHRVAGGEESRQLVRDFLRFQSRDYEIQVAEDAPAKYVADRVAAAMDLRARDEQVESEVDRLSHLIEARAESNLQAVLLVIAGSGVFQTICSYLALEEPKRLESLGPLVWVVVVTVGLAGWVKLRK